MRTGVASLAAVILLAGCHIGSAPKADPCKEPKATALRLLKTGDQGQARIAARVVINNRACFASEELAMAQELLAKSS